MKKKWLFKEIEFFPDSDQQVLFIGILNSLMLGPFGSKLSAFPYLCKLSDPHDSLIQSTQRDKMEIYFMHQTSKNPNGSGNRESGTR